MKLFFLFLFCVISFSILESSHSLPPSSKIKHLLKQTDVETIVNLRQTLEVKLNTPCVFISWLLNREMYHQFLSQLPDVNRQILMNFNNSSATIGTRKQSPKFTSVCNLVLSNFKFHSDDLDTLTRNDELQQSYHFLMLEVIKNAKAKFKSPRYHVQLRNAILILPRRKHGTEYFDLDYAGALRTFQRENVHFRHRWNFHGHPVIYVIRSGRINYRKELISQFRESTQSEIILATAIVVSKSFNGTLQISQVGVKHLSEAMSKAHFRTWNPIRDSLSSIMIPTIVIRNSGLAFFTAKAKRIPRKNPLEFLFLASDPVIWMFKLGCLSVTVASILAIELVTVERGRNNGKSSNIPVRVLSLFAGFFRLVAQQNITHRLETLLQRTKIKLMMGPWLLGLIILNSDLQTRLSSSLTSPGWIIPPKRFDQLSKSSYKINTFGYKKSTVGRIFRDLMSQNHSLVLRLSEKFGTDFQYSDSVSCLATIQTGDNVCMGPRGVGIANALRSLITAFGEPLYKVSEDSMISTSSALYLSKKYCHLAKRLNYVISGYFESGIFQKWFEGESFAKIGRKNARTKLNTRSQERITVVDEDVVSDGKAPLSSIFIVLVGNGLGLIVFGWEVRTRIITLVRNGVVALATCLPKKRAVKTKPKNVKIVPVVEVNFIDIE